VSGGGRSGLHDLLGRSGWAYLGRWAAGAAGAGSWGGREPQRRCGGRGAAAAAACFNCVGEPGTTCVLAAGLFGTELRRRSCRKRPSSSRASLKPIFARFSFCALTISAVLASAFPRADHHQLRIDGGLDEGEQHGEACEGSEHPQEGGAGFFGLFGLRHGKNGDQLTTFTDSMRRGSRHGYRLYLARPRR
jgi:hypothetical protein